MQWIRKPKRVFRVGILNSYTKSIPKTKGTGWMKDYPEFRDNTPSTNAITAKQELRGVDEAVYKILSKLDRLPKRDLLR
jgi:hypothetical protein